MIQGKQDWRAETESGQVGIPGKTPESKSRFPRSRQAPSTELSTSSSAHSKSCDQLRCSPYLGSGDITDALSVHSAGSSSSDVEEINMSFVPESPDGQEKKVMPMLPPPALLTL